MWNRKALETMVADFYDHQDSEEPQDQMQEITTEQIAKETQKAYGNAFSDAYLDYGGDGEEGL